MEKWSADYLQSQPSQQLGQSTQVSQMQLEHEQAWVGAASWEDDAMLMSAAVAKTIRVFIVIVIFEG